MNAYPMIFIYIYIKTPYFVNTSFSTRRRMDIRLTHLLLLSIISLPLYSKRVLFKGLIREGLRRKHSVNACPMIEWHRYVNRWSTFPGRSMEHFDKHFREPVSRNEITINAALLYPAATLRPA